MNRKEIIRENKKKKTRKQFLIGFSIFILIFVFGLVKKELQNDTFYAIKIGELVFKNGIDMLDHFSFHNSLPYTYPHWLYDCFIYLVFKFSGYAGIYA